jgi:serine/threonine protein kinase/Tol biopolymer transport system component
MSLPAGTSIGSYEILALVGEGGMGQVYRARDSRLDRLVAIKVLPDSFSRDPDRLARFEREARLLASLNHPQIAQVYGLEQGVTTRAPLDDARGAVSDNRMALVMELVEGPTLADRIAQGALPHDDALAIARQLAAALEAAHDQGIIHRDLKPANIKLRPDGAVKVLDFGLAKLADASPGSSSATALTSPGMTQAGIVLGTPAYMSPEQARGLVVDGRADVWALGCVWFEMLTGRRAFDGETASDAISAVLTRDPSWDALPKELPPPVRRLLRRCLARDATKRLRHAGDLRLELDEIAANQTPDDAPGSNVRTSATPVIPWLVAVAASLVAAWLGWNLWGANRSAPGPTPTIRLELTLPAGLELFPSTASTVVASPDGRSVGFVGTSGEGRQIFVRRLDEFAPQPVAGTTGATTFAYAADGQSLVFVTAGGELRTVSLADGLVTTVTKGASLLYGVTPTANDELVFVREGTLWSIPRAGGDARKLTTRAASEHLHAWPSALPDGRALVFTVETASGPQAVLLTLATGERRLILNQASRAKFGPDGHLFFYRDGRLLAMTFDLTSQNVTGTPMPVLETVPDLGGGTPVGDVSPAGLLVFAPDSAQRRLVWVSREGAEEVVSDQARSYVNPRLSPDGTRIVVQAGSIWVHDLRRKAIERVATLSTAANAFPMWMPDGVTVLHRSGIGIRVQSTDTGTAGRTVTGTTEFDYPTSVTADGKSVIFNRSSPDTSFDVLLAPFDDFKAAIPLVQSPAYEAGARLSPDGRWLVYVSNDSGRNEVYLRPFRGDWRRQVSTDGGTQPVWNPNGREVFYRIGDRMMAVEVTTSGQDARLSAPKQLFARAFSYGAGITMANYDITKDGQRFLMVRDDTTIGRLRVVLNWHADAGAPPK